MVRRVDKDFVGIASLCGMVVSVVLIISSSVAVRPLVPPRAE